LDNVLDTTRARPAARRHALAGRALPAVSGRQLTIVGFLSPAVALLLGVLGIPITAGIALSFTDWNLLTGNAAEFIGLDNYIALLSEPGFLSAAWITVVITVTALAGQFVLGLAAALALARNFRGRGLITTCLILPMMIASVVASLQWRWLYSAEYGLLNWVLGMLGVPGHAWLSDPATVVPAIVVVDVWQSTPFVMLFLLAGLQSLPTEVYEAAALDGAGRLQQFVFVTLPMLKPVIVVVMLYRAIFTFRLFDQIYAMTGGGPANMTQTLAFYSYKAAFSDWRIGYGAAAAVAMMLVLVLIGAAYLAVLKTENTVE
jgi:multiple sugar transport system permease protein